jgi:hypothetical protein
MRLLQMAYTSFIIFIVKIANIFFMFLELYQKICKNSCWAILPEAQPGLWTTCTSLSLPAAKQLRYYKQYDLSVSVTVYTAVLLFSCWPGKTRYELLVRFTRKNQGDFRIDG